MIKKSIIIGAISLFCINNVNGQVEDSRKRLEFGMKAGANLSNVWDSQGENFRADNKYGLAGGIFLGIPLGKIVGLQPEVLVSQKGFEGSGSLLGQNYSFARTTTYVDIPLQLQIKPVRFITLVAGPQFSYLLNQKDVYTFGNNSTEQEQAFKNENIRKNILGFVVGADVYYKHLVVSGRVNRDYQTNNEDGTSNTPRYKNQLLQLTLGYKF